MTSSLVNEYGWHASISPHTSEYISPTILKILETLKADRVLDLGAGNGALCSLLKSAGYNVVGIEPDAQGVSIAQSTNPSIAFYRYGVQDDPSLLLSSESLFDAVVSTEVVEHLFSPHLLPRYAAATLKSGGFLVISTPYHGYLKNLAPIAF